MWLTKCALAVTKNLGVRVDFQPCSEGDFLTGFPWSVKKIYYLSRWYLDYLFNLTDTKRKVAGDINTYYKNLE